MAEKATPVTPDEADDIRVTLDLDNGCLLYTSPSPRDRG